MKVVFVAIDFYSREGGMQQFNRRVFRCLMELRAGGEVKDVCALSLWDREEGRGQVPEGVRFVPGRRSKLKTFFMFLVCLGQSRPHVVLYGHVLLAPLMLLTRLVHPRGRNIVFVHGIEVWQAPPILRGWMVRRCADEVVAVSRLTTDRMQSAYRIAARKFRLLPNAVDVQERTFDRPGTNARLEGRYRLLSVARLEPQDRGKNIDKVIDAMPQLLSEFPDTHYYIIGDGAWRPELEALALERGVADHVHMLGRIDDSRRDRLYAESHVFVMPSSKEGFGIVFLEAWLHRLPVIAGTEDAAPEVVRHGVDGLCVDPRPEAIASAIRELLGDEGKRREMGVAGLRRVREEYTHERFRERLRAVLSETSQSADDYLPRD